MSSTWPSPWRATERLSVHHPSPADASLAAADAGGSPTPALPDSPPPPPPSSGSSNYPPPEDAKLTLPDRVTYAWAKENSNPQKMTKTVLLVAALLSLAQVCAAIALKLVGRTYSIDVLGSEDHRMFNSLPAVMSVTTYTLQVWLGAAMALWGLWLWNRKLRRDGAASYDDMAGWGALIASRASDLMFKSATIGLPVAATFAVLTVLVLLASSGVVDAVTLASGERTIAGSYSVPTTYAYGTFTNASNAFANADWNPVVYTALAAAGPKYNISTISIGGALVALDDLGLANPAVLQSYTSNSTLRPDKYASDTSFVEASMCMPGVTANPTCTPVYNWRYAPANATQREAITMNYTDACGASQEAALAAGWKLDVTPCSADGAVHLTWLTANVHSGSFLLNVTQVNCALNLAVGAEWMTIYRRNGQTGVERAAGGNGGECEAPANLTVSLEVLGLRLNNHVAQTLEPGVTEYSIETALAAAARDPTSNVYLSNAQFAANLADISGLVYRATYTALVSDSFVYDSSSQATNYGVKEDSRYGIATATEETYRVAVLGQGNKWYLGFLFPTAVVILLSLRLHRPAVRVFDPSDPAAVARVVLQQAPIQTEAELEEGNRRFKPPYSLVGGSWTKA